MTSALERLNAALADRYRIERELGQGGMATVYLAHDLRHDRDSTSDRTAASSCCSARRNKPSATSMG